MNGKTAWNMLNGIFNVYKPPEIHFENIKKTLILNICRDLNEITVRTPSKYVSIEGPTNTKMKVVVRDSYADNALVVGPPYVVDDFKMTAANYLHQESSGILIFGVNYGTKLIHILRDAKLTKFYKLKGILGQIRDNNFKTGKITIKSTWKHIKRENIDRVCASMQASHQKKMFDLCGLDIQSQDAYEAAVKGLIRPTDFNVPMLYTIKCIDFEPPEFTVEIVSMNESHDYLKEIISEIGIRLHSTAHCSYIQCSQYGLFNVKDALLSKHWNLKNILNNINTNRNILSKQSDLLTQYHTHLVQQDKLDDKLTV